MNWKNERKIEIVIESQNIYLFSKKFAIVQESKK